MILKVIFSNSVKNVNNSLMGIAFESINYFRQYRHFHDINSSYLLASNVSPSVCVLSDFVEQWFVVFLEEVPYVPCELYS